MNTTQLRGQAMIVKTAFVALSTDCPCRQQANPGEPCDECRHAMAESPFPECTLEECPLLHRNSRAFHVLERNP